MRRSSAPAPVRFAELTSEQAGALLRDPRRAVLLLPIGAVEPHGPHAPLATDGIIAETICERAARAVADDRRLRALVLPAIPYGVTRYAAGFPGALHIDEATLHALVVDLCRTLIADGFGRIALVNHHFEPDHVAVLRRAVETLADAGGHVGLLDLTRRRNAARLTDEFRRGSCHAGRYETSLVLAERPELIAPERAQALPALEIDMPAEIAAGRTDFHAMGMARAYCGDPAEATAAEGEASYEALVELLVELMRELAAAG